jgi:hypothetical protein
MLGATIKGAQSDKKDAWNDKKKMLGMTKNCSE